MLHLYKLITYLSAPVLAVLLWHRVRIGKEDPKRLSERWGISSQLRPEGQLIWIHAASVGEAQSALILIEKIQQEKPDAHFLVTSGTVTSATLMAKRLPQNAIHQYYPLDRSKWVINFLNHWQPDLALWMESELWPNMLRMIRRKKIPAILVNARLSIESYRRWKTLKHIAQKVLSAFQLILTQTDLDQKRYQSLGAENVIVTDNLKYSASPLPCNDSDLKDLQKNIGERKIWLYASTHDGEETLACRVHRELKETYPDLLTIIVPRHPERREEINKQCHIMGLKTLLRGDNKNLPAADTDIYIADTLGELGLFYRLSAIALIGRSFSNDGGGGHNPIEPAQLNCVVLTGPNIQYQLELFDDMIAQNAAIKLQNEQDLNKILKSLLSNESKKKEFIIAAKNFADSKNTIINGVMENIRPFLSVPKKKWYHAK